MSLLAVGDTRNAICSTCKRQCEATCRLGDLPFSDGIGVAKDIPAWKCNGCGQVVGIPAQSRQSIRLARQGAVAALNPFGVCWSAKDRSCFVDGSIDTLEDMSHD